MKPLIKWPGGKSSEFVHIEHIIPSYNRYIEPFFGGGAIFFNLKKGKAIINDKSENLMTFYNLIKTGNEKFRETLYEYNRNWDIMGVCFGNIYPDLYTKYMEYRQNDISGETLLSNMLVVLNKHKYTFLNMFDHRIIIDNKKLFSEVQDNFLDKIKRMVELEIKMDSKLNDSDLRDNMETGFRSGFYMHFRNIYNDIALKRENVKGLVTEEKIANFYFIREYCYGSMFRYNRKGEFNIPFGGIAYNKKDFKKKIDHLFNSGTIKHFENVEIYNMDFEKCLNQINLTNDDFMFLDPPYDTDFSDYEGSAFDKADQLRLANFLLTTPAKFILIIKKTDYIYQLYQEKDNIIILDFDKQYTYNVRSRNNRDVNHLIVTNCEVREELDELCYTS